MYTTSMVRGSDYKSTNILAGTIAGLLGGAAMALLMMVVSSAAGMGFWHPMEMVGALFYGVDALLGGAGPVVTGVLVHLLCTGAVGALFGALLPPRQATTGLATSWGVVAGVVCWAVDSFLLLPVFNQTMKDRVDLAPGWWFLSFVLMGAVLGATPAIRRSIARRTTNVDLLADRMDRVA